MSAVQLYFETAGDTGAPPLLLGGSLGTTLAMWEPQLELRHARRLIRFDHRGHGRPVFDRRAGARRARADGRARLGAGVVLWAVDRGHGRTVARDQRAGPD